MRTPDKIGRRTAFADEIEPGDRIWIPGLTLPNLLVEDARKETAESEGTVLTVWTEGADSYMVEIVLDPERVVWLSSTSVGGGQ